MSQHFSRRSENAYVVLAVRVMLPAVRTYLFVFVESSITLPSMRATLGGEP